MAYQILLTEDVTSLGRKGQVVKVRPGYARNFLLPERKGVVADPQTLRMQKKLQDERAKQALVDRKDAEDLAAKLNGVALETTVKVDQEGHLYGSVTAQDISEILKQTTKIELDKKHFVLRTPLKTTGIHDILLKLNEGVTCNITIAVLPDVLPQEKPKREHVEPKEQEKTKE